MYELLLDGRNGLFPTAHLYTITYRLLVLTHPYQVCNNAIGGAEFYDHAKTEQWNSTIIVRSPGPNPLADASPRKTND